MSHRLDLAHVRALLAELAACEEKLADRGPIKVLPRPAAEVPNVPLLTARTSVIQAALQVRRKSASKPTGHDMDIQGDGAGGVVVVGPLRGRDLKAVGVLEEIRSIEKGQDRALPNTSVVVRVHFPGSGDHLWFDPDDLLTVDRESEASKP